jgi:hypothetical protein
MFAVLAAVACSVLLLACAGPSHTPVTESESAPVETAPADPSEPPAAEVVVKAGREPSFKAIYKLSGTVGTQRISQEQTWYVKRANTRLDLANGYSIYRLDGQLFQCFTQSTNSSCVTLSPLQAAANRRNLGQLQLEFMRRLVRLDVQEAGTESL